MTKKELDELKKRNKIRRWWYEYNFEERCKLKKYRAEKMELFFMQYFFEYSDTEMHFEKKMKENLTAYPAPGVVYDEIDYQHLPEGCKPYEVVYRQVGAAYDKLGRLSSPAVDRDDEDLFKRVDDVDDYDIDYNGNFGADVDGDGADLNINFGADDTVDLDDKYISSTLAAHEDIDEYVKRIFSHKKRKTGFLYMKDFKELSSLFYEEEYDDEDPLEREEGENEFCVDGIMALMNSPVKFCFDYLIRFIFMKDHDYYDKNFDKELIDFNTKLYIKFLINEKKK